MPPLAFNAMRLAVACIVLSAVARLSGVTLPQRSDWWRLAVLGLVGHCGYQLFFVLGLAQTSVTNSSLILGCLPVTVLLLNSGSWHREAVGYWQWVGVLLALLGLYLVVGVDDTSSGETLLGDVFVVAALGCWSWYTVGSRYLLQRYTPLQVTVSTTVVGTIGFLPFSVPSLLALNWGEVSRWAWGAVALSGLLALSLSYVLWYTGVQRLGSSRTAIYSNLVPVVAMVVAAVSLGETIGLVKLIGATLVLTALVLTRMEAVGGMGPIQKGSGSA
jgi:drug/metabolite transporter (DMT)-like permease